MIMSDKPNRLTTVVSTRLVPILTVLDASSIIRSFILMEIE